MYYKFVYSTNILIFHAIRFLNIHVLISERNHPAYNKENRFIWFLLRRVLYPLADHLIVQTQKIKNWFKDYNKSIYIIKSPVRITRRNMEIEPEIALPSGKRIVTMSQLIEQKGFDLLIKVFARVYKSYKDWNLIIIGTGQLFDEISQKAKQLGVDKAVYFPCRVKNPSILFVI